jgi:hypothetical protein
MAFSDDVIKQAWNRSGGRCECQRTAHDHSVFRCPRKLTWANRGREGEGAWEAHHVSVAGGDGLSNCQILCWTCHKKTQSFGG